MEDGRLEGVLYPGAKTDRHQRSYVVGRANAPAPGGTPGSTQADACRT